MPRIFDEIYSRFLMRKKGTSMYLVRTEFNGISKDDINSWSIRRKKDLSWAEEQAFKPSFYQQFGTFEWVELSEKEIKDYRFDLLEGQNLYCFSSKKSAYDVLRKDMKMSISELRDIECKWYNGYTEPLLSRK